MALDERLRRELERAGRPADPTGTYEELIRRRERRRILRRIEVAGLAILVIAGSSLGFLALSRVFRTKQVPAAGLTNGRIAFINSHPDLAIPEQSAGWYISTIEPDGSDLTFVGPLHVDEVLFPSFSPDGTRIAFFGFDDLTKPHRGDPVGSIYVANADGSHLREVFRPQADQQVEAVVWSPDGSRIGYVLAQGYESGIETDLSWTIWTMTPDGTDHRRVTSTGREMHFSWSPDAARIVFERWSPIRERADLGSAGSDLFIVDADGRNEERITDDGVSREPAWSPDGTQIAFVHGHPGDQYVAVIGVDGHGLRELAARADHVGGVPHGNRVMWSPDGTLIAFSGLMNDDACHISTVDPLDGSVRTLISMPTLEGCPGRYGMSWAPQVGSSSPSTSPMPSESPPTEPTPSESPDSMGQDIGLGFPVCNVTSVVGEFAPGVQGTAYVATRIGDTGCPEGSDGFHVVAVDVTGDGVVDASYGPIECETLPCSAFAGPDVDDDGTDELLVQNIAFSIVGLRLYEVRADPPDVFPVTVATPGYPESGLPPGAEPQLWFGGDAFNLDALRCATSPNGRVLILTSATAVPGDSPDSVWQAAETVFALQPDGTVTIVSSRTYEEPVGSGPPSFAVPGDGICGARIANSTF